MAEELYRFERPVELSELIEEITEEGVVAVEKTGCKADFAKVDKALKTLVGNPKTKRTDFDIVLAEELHRALGHLPVDVRLDMRFWHWMTITRFRQLVWHRWFNGPPKDIEKALGQPAKKHRFLGTRSLRGRNRNALSRLFFTADILYDKNDGYKLTKTAFVNQDRHTSIFERELGLVPDAAKALVRFTAGMDSKEIQRSAKRLNHIASTLVLEVVDEADLKRSL